MPVARAIVKVGQRIAGNLVEHDKQCCQPQQAPQNQIGHGDQNQRADDDADDRARQQQTQTGDVPLAPVNAHRKEVARDEQGHGNANCAGHGHALGQNRQHHGAGEGAADAALDQTNQNGGCQNRRIEFHGLFPNVSGRSIARAQGPRALAGVGTPCYAGAGQ